MAKSEKYNSFNYQYTLLLLDAREQVIGGLTSNRDMDGTKRLARSILHLEARVAFVGIFPYVAHVADLANCDPIEQMSLDDEGAGDE